MSTRIKKLEINVNIKITNDPSKIVKLIKVQKNLKEVNIIYDDLVSLDLAHTYKFSYKNWYNLKKASLPLLKFLKAQHIPPEISAGIIENTNGHLIEISIYHEDLETYSCNLSKLSNLIYLNLALSTYVKEGLKSIYPSHSVLRIPRADFFDKVRPYKAIIPDQIYEEIEEFYYKDTLPKTITLSSRIGPLIRTSNFESNIIKPILTNIIANWIDNKDAKYIRTINDSLYKFILVYRGSRDGIDNILFKNN
ncbi:hypothetical protein GLOIN_2v1470532 [Rhizophagus clarus]|uniref:Uncharacterized protein n=1 Tax=Rhizophagus clarus TaxID=94130 RepID=A0A8H3LK48_9GLOM|nr:hypothetical protein GLOIN_2v1470532 [Rhizophagus clarus]